MANYTVKAAVIIAQPIKVADLVSCGGVVSMSAGYAVVIIGTNTGLDI